MFLLHRCFLCIYGFADADGLREGERMAVSSGTTLTVPSPPAKTKSCVCCQLGTAQPPSAFGEYLKFYNTFVTSKSFMT